MSTTSASRPRQNRRVSRRVFLHSTSVIPAALASPPLLQPLAAVTTTCADFDVEAGEPCESRLPIVVGVPLQPFAAQVTRLIAAAEGPFRSDRWQFIPSGVVTLSVRTGSQSALADTSHHRSTPNRSA
jgi:hypothetical protein